VSVIPVRLLLGIILPDKCMYAQSDLIFHLLNAVSQKNLCVSNRLHQSQNPVCTCEKDCKLTFLFPPFFNIYIYTLFIMHNMIYSNQISILIFCVYV